MIIIDNDYMINERAIDVRAKLKIGDNASNIAEIFFKNLSLRVYDYVINNNIKYKTRFAIDSYLDTLEKQEDFKRALAEQAIYFLSVGDTSLMLPDDVARWIGHDGWNKLGFSESARNVLKQLGLLYVIEVIY